MSFRGCSMNSSFPKNNSSSKILLKKFCNYFLLQPVASIDYTVTLLANFITSSGFRSYSDRISFILGGGQRCFGTYTAFTVFLNYYCQLNLSNFNTHR